MRQGGAPAARARAGLVLLHGRGAPAAGMLSMFDALALPDVAALAPEAPGRSWWPTSFLAPMAALSPWLEGALDAVAEAVSALEAGGLPRRAIFLCGFSQGGCLALEFAARQGAGLGGAFGFSAALVGTADVPDEPRADLFGHLAKRFDYPGRLDAVHVDMSCHERDPHIPLARFEESAMKFRGLGADVVHRVYPGAGHGMTEEDVAALRGRLNRPEPPAR